jgi:hypothetical protein
MRCPTCSDTPHPGFIAWYEVEVREGVIVGACIRALTAKVDVSRVAATEGIVVPTKFAEKPKGASLLGTNREQGTCLRRAGETGPFTLGVVVTYRSVPMRLKIGRITGLISREPTVDAIEASGCAGSR